MTKYDSNRKQRKKKFKVSQTVIIFCMYTRVKTSTKLSFWILIKYIFVNLH